MTDRLGIGVMMKMLFSGNEETAKVFHSCIGKEIAALELQKSHHDGYSSMDRLLFTFSDETKMAVWDGDQSCCEDRYMHTDDKLADFVNSMLINGEIRDAPDIEDESGEVHEVQFLIITTSKGAFTVETHNEHNGYYGGFWIEAARVED